MKHVRKMKAIAFGVVMAVALAGCGSAPQQPAAGKAGGSEPAPAPTAAAKKELSGKLVIYTGAGPEITDPLFEGFKKKYPNIKPELVKAGSGELLARIAAEKDNPGGDILLGGEPYAFDTSKQYFDAYESPTDKDMIRQDPNHIWHVWTFMPQAILVNTKLLKDQAEWPKTLKDLSDPKWKAKGKIAFADPGKSGTGAGILNGIVSLYDWNFVEQMQKNIEVSPGSDAMFAAVKDGAVPLGFINEDLGAKWEQTGVPVKMIFPSDGVTNTLDSLAVIKGAKDADNAKAFIDYMGSKEAHEIMKDQVLRRSTRKDVAPPQGLADLSKLKMIENKPMTRDELSSGFNTHLENARK
ncbi:extracellular solute-binding protein [Paenibacillus cremeus]|uniref:Extracellular solute-binding protein n=1 Tax=Paenibacillus cremeus TaxID=2163881 RepID=A0A559K7M2_9BACL|nr:extracellular solute-binding protein [Paenibacillus cremeus]TVY08131.1 extracellular solute-binding protein [Paenibacillus cremeus]